MGLQFTAPLPSALWFCLPGSPSLFFPAAEGAGEDGAGLRVPSELLPDVPPGYNPAL